MPLDLVQLYRDSLAALTGERLVARALAGRAQPSERVRVLALGKASAAMVRGAASALGEATGVAVGPAPAEVPSGVRWLSGTHPVPGLASEAAARALLAEAAAAGPDDRVVVLLSGGGSALAALPAPGLTLADKVQTTRALLHGGVPIEEVNAVRKHLSAIKGGQLALACPARSILALVLCDIPSGELDAVASGPVSPDRTTFARCLALAQRHGLALPSGPLARLREGAAGAIAETPKPGDSRLAHVELVGLATPSDLARTAADLARARGLPCEAAPGAFSGPLEALASEVVERARALPAGTAWAVSGEPVLRVPDGSGPGGRMQHLALHLARALPGSRVQVLCAGSDGRDGDTSHAGAVVDGATAARAAAAGLDLDAALARFDSAAACAALGLAIPSFASDTNLCDLVLVQKEA